MVVTGWKSCTTATSPARPVAPFDEPSRSPAQFGLVIGLPATTVERPGTKVGSKLT
jgi:hypothetical protein